MSDRDPAVMEAVIHDLLLERPGADTLLDRFAGQAMQSLLGSQPWWNNNREDDADEGTEGYARRTARFAYAVARQMLRERDAVLDGLRGGRPSSG